MGFLWTLIIGLVVGAIAKLLMPGKDPGGFIITMLLGVAGALLAGFIGRALGWYSDPGTGPGIIASIIGAMLLGVAGALLAGFIGRALGWYSDPGQGPGIIASIIGAMLLLLLYRLFVGRRTTVP